MPTRPRSSPRPASRARPGGAQAPFAVHLLDVGPEEYGDAILCQFGSTSVLIDGAHPGNWRDKGDDHPAIQRQVAELLGQGEGPVRVSLLIVTHAHADHIGCLPTLVDQGLLAAEWALVADPRLGWGLTPEDAVGALADDRPAVRQLAALLREETRTTGSDAELAAFAADAAGQEARYHQMLQQLEERGTQVVRYGQDDPRALLDAFAEVGLAILGPSEEALVRCAELIRGRSTLLSEAATGLLGPAADADAADAPERIAEAYRRFLVGAVADDAADAVDALGKDKGAINDQSLVTAFAFRGQTLLFTGDMQLSEPEVSDRAVADYITGDLRAALTARAPYALVKLPHHGSYNGFDDDVFEALGQPTLVGMCAGSGSKSHPNPQTLDLLRGYRRRRLGVQWVRTDHNGRTTFTFAGDAEPDVDVTRGRLNDGSPPGGDASLEAVPAPATSGERSTLRSPAEQPVSGPPTPPAPETPAPPTSSGTPLSASRPGRADGVVEVITRIPHVATRVTVAVDVQPGRGAAAAPLGEGAAGPGAPPSPGGPGEGRPFDHGGGLAAGRPLPRLLFVTNAAQLARNIGEAEAASALTAIRDAGHGLVSDVPAGPGAEQAALARVRAGLPPNVAGVVLLGGYDVVPSQRVDALPPRLRQTVGNGGDADAFVVWNDDGYGDRDGDGLPELPVSRIPDARSSELVRAALGAGAADPSAIPRRGLRNVMRPFADVVYGRLPGASAMLTSRPTLFNAQPTYTLDGERVYVMLHGSDTDATRFWGEDGGAFPVAMHIENVPRRAGMVAFTGCCWGALPVDTKARDLVPGRPLGARTPGQSIALTFLKHGARAFVGCTGSHYSPTRAPYGYFGQPMHDVFWQRYAAGRSPAQALFDAKLAYMRDLPHGQARGGVAEAVEFKILRAYTCLGLGW